MTTIHSDGTRPRPSVFGSLGYLLMNLVVGILGFVGIVTAWAVGAGTAVVWVGLPVLALAILGTRGAARVERARVYAMLDTYIATPYPPLPVTGRWKARLKDGATWRDTAYFVLLLPIGVAEFSIMIALWSASAWLVALPLVYRFLPDGAWLLWDTDHPRIVVDSFLEALPFAGAGLVLLALTVPLTRAMGAAHAVFARSVLGPSQAKIRSLEPWESDGVRVGV
ncbi:sensor domain-containing protein [Actinokineospora sp. NBRC 105648]|uniref:sensor domain-containing protein n=1 Tax=Actinokineospora sp. NBRC 105648 TaxID=3032206 RepID=UPI0024A2123B|nr:sensor domain-containing protein [Actinokineospora sp. NBRC 105648]GLZ41621.1 hypothetical protein Acsp05_52450 [Actinokineospora sp. NBRC 105648]